MYCSSCGRQLPDNTNFCIYCGAAANPAPAFEPAPAPAFEPAPTPAYQPPFAPAAPKKHTAVGVLVMAILIIVARFICDIVNIADYGNTSNINTVYSVTIFMIAVFMIFASLRPFETRGKMLFGFALFLFSISYIANVYSSLAPGYTRNAVDYMFLLFDLAFGALCILSGITFIADMKAAEKPLRLVTGIGIIVYDMATKIYIYALGFAPYGNPVPAAFILSYIEVCLFAISILCYPRRQKQ